MYPSIYSREICTVMGDRMMKQRWEYPLLLVGCYLNPWFREIEFVRDENLRPKYRSKAEEFTRK